LFGLATDYRESVTTLPSVFLLPVTIMATIFLSLQTLGSAQGVG